MILCIKNTTVSVWPLILAKITISFMQLSRIKSGANLFIFFCVVHEMVQIGRGSVVTSHHSNYGARVLAKWGRGQQHL